jgi:hypothetical protein
MRRQGLASASRRASEALRETCTTRRRHLLFAPQLLANKFWIDTGCTALPRTVHRFCTHARFARTIVAVAVVVWTAVAGVAAQAPPPDVASSTFRVFLRDGRALPAYGESAVVADRVVFSLLVGGGPVPTAIQLVTLPASSVDLGRTARYAKAVRAAYFAATTGEAEYQALTSQIASTLDALPAISDPALRLQLAEEARERLVTWSADHYDYRAAEVRQFLAQFEGVIGRLRGGTSDARLTMDLVAGATGGAHEAVLPPPTLRESIEAAIATATVADDLLTREAVLKAIVDTLRGGSLEADLVADVRRRLNDELDADRAYADLNTELLTRADAARRRGDVPAVESLAGELARRDLALGSRRPEAIQALADALSARLAVTRAFRASLDHYAKEKPKLLAYERRVRPVLFGLESLRPELQAIRDGRPAGYDATMRTLARLSVFEKTLTALAVPSDLFAVHAALHSAIGLAREACVRHRQVLIAPKSATSADASAAAAGSVLLLTQAHQDLLTRLFPPKAS